MAKINLQNRVELLDIERYLATELRYKVVKKGSVIRVILDNFRGCGVRLKPRKDGGTNIFIGGCIPSLSLALVFSLLRMGGCLALLFFILPGSFHINVVITAVLFMITGPSKI